MAFQNSKISNFISSVGQGVKPNMFQVELAFPASGVGADNTKAVSNEDIALSNLLCKSAALPGSNLGVIEVPFRGRTVKIAGDRTFDTWSPTFIVDKNMKTRSLFEQWMESINGHAGNTADLITPDNSAGYTADIFVHQLEKGKAPDEAIYIRSYKLWYAFPTNVSQIDLAYDSNDQIEEFSVEFQYSYWTTENVGNAASGDYPVNADVTQ